MPPVPPPRDARHCAPSRAAFGSQISTPKTKILSTALHLCVQRIIILACVWSAAFIAAIFIVWRKGAVLNGSQHCLNRVTFVFNTAQYESSYFCRAQISTYHATREVSYSRSRYATTNVGGSALRRQIMATGRKTPVEPRSIPLWQLSDSKPKISLQQVRVNFNYRGIDL